MITTAKLTTKRNEILTIAARHGAKNLRIFGSVARGEATEASDSIKSATSERRLWRRRIKGEPHEGSNVRSWRSLLSVVRPGADQPDSPSPSAAALETHQGKARRNSGNTVGRSR